MLVFNCDETSECKAMAQIFLDCATGDHGRFDEFNRLKERTLSAISQQVEIIQKTLKSHKEGNSLKVDLNGKEVTVKVDTAIFITTNPPSLHYAGRSNLPSNLKILLRAFAMTSPDLQLNAEVAKLCFSLSDSERLRSWPRRRYFQNW